jgi:hypothetical protein
MRVNYIGIKPDHPQQSKSEYFEDIKNEKVPKDMLDLALHIVDTKRGDFDPEKFEDQYEDALNSEFPLQEFEGRRVVQFASDVLIGKGSLESFRFVLWNGFDPTDR